MYPGNETAWPCYFQNRILMFCVTARNLYIPRIGLLMLLKPNRQTNLGNIYVNRSQIHGYRNWERGRAVSFLGIYKSDV
jgi:hypothetical protein